MKWLQKLDLRHKKEHICSVFLRLLIYKNDSLSGYVGFLRSNVGDHSFYYMVFGSGKKTN